MSPMSYIVSNYVWLSLAVFFVPLSWITFLHNEIVLIFYNLSAKYGLS